MNGVISYLKTYWRCGLSSIHSLTKECGLKKRRALTILWKSVGHSMRGLKDLFLFPFGFSKSHV